jgi:plastocyanin
MNLRLVLVPAFAGMLVLGACGDDSGTGSNGGAAPAASGGAVTTAPTSGGDAYSGGYAIPPDVSSQAAGGATAADTVVAKNIAYNPTQITVKKGDTVTFKNEDGFAHTFTADNGDFDSGNVDGGTSFQYVVDEDGTIAFHCKIHSNMKGTITVEA